MCTSVPSTAPTVGTVVHNAAHMSAVWLELQMSEKFLGKIVGDSPPDAAGRGGSALGALSDPRGEFFDVIEDFTSLGHLRQDFSLRVHDRGVVTAERLADLR